MPVNISLLNHPCSKYLKYLSSQKPMNTKDVLNEYQIRVFCREIFMSGDFLISLKQYYYVLSKKPRLLLNFIRYADSSGPELSAIELGCEMALPEPFLDVMLVKKLQIQLGSGTYLRKYIAYNFCFNRGFCRQ